MSLLEELQKNRRRMLLVLGGVWAALIALLLVLAIVMGEPLILGIAAWLGGFCLLCMGIAVWRQSANLKKLQKEFDSYALEQLGEEFRASHRIRNLGFGKEHLFSTEGLPQIIPYSDIAKASVATTQQMFMQTRILTIVRKSGKKTRGMSLVVKKDADVVDLMKFFKAVNPDIVVDW